MNTKKILGGAALAASAVSLAVAPAALAGATLPKVSVRVEGKTKTLLRAADVRPKPGWITRYGAPKHACSTDTVQGALGVATKGRWKGTWYTSYREYLITGILGETESGVKNYWEVFVGHVAASAGACELALQRGEHVLFAAVPSTGKAELPTGITGPTGGAKLGVPFTVHVVLYNAKGKPHPLSGATVKGGGLTATTNAKGNATLVATKTGKLVLTASHKAEIRSETVVKIAS
jgi:hypothetical protein